MSDKFSDDEDKKLIKEVLRQHRDYVTKNSASIFYLNYDDIDPLIPSRSHVSLQKRCKRIKASGITHTMLWSSNSPIDWSRILTQFHIYCRRLDSNHNARQHTKKSKQTIWQNVVNKINIEEHDESTYLKVYCCEKLVTKNSTISSDKFKIYLKNKYRYKLMGGVLYLIPSYNFDFAEISLMEAIITDKLIENLALKQIGFIHDVLPLKLFQLMEPIFIDDIHVQINNSKSNNLSIEIFYKMNKQIGKPIKCIIYWKSNTNNKKQATFSFVPALSGNLQVRVFELQLEIKQQKKCVSIGVSCEYNMVMFFEAIFGTSFDASNGLIINDADSQYKNMKLK